MYNAGMTLRQAIIQVQEIGERYGFTIAIVGGGIVRLISKGVKIQRIDAKGKVIYLSNTKNPGVTREEDPTTTIDIDAIAISSKKNPFTRETRTNFEKMTRELQLLRSASQNFPAISLEPIFYHPTWGNPNQIFQFVSSVEQYPTHSDHFLFRLGTIRQSVKEASLAVWTYVFIETNESIQSLLPQAIQLRYAIRGFSKKPKDIEKIWGEKSAFATFVKDFQTQTHNQYDNLFDEWKLFEKKVQRSTSPSIWIKRGLWNLYWQTIGTYLAHGTGIIGKILLPLGNTFFAGK